MEFMARGSKKKYTRKQKRKAEKIARGYKKRGVSKKEAKRRAWATVNKSDKGGRKKGGGGRGKRRRKRVRAKAGEKAAGKRKSVKSARCRIKINRSLFYRTRTAGERGQNLARAPVAVRGRGGVQEKSQARLISVEVASARR